MSAWELDILQNGVVVGFGPLLTAQSFDDTLELDTAGDVSTEVPLADPKVDLVAERQTIRCSTLRGGQWVTFGTGIVDALTEDIQPDAPPLLEIGGNGPLIALADRTVGSLVLTDSAHSHNENPMLKADILAAIMAYAPAGWSVVGEPSEDVYLPFSGETVLAALGKLAEQLGDHFVYEAPQTLRWLPKSTAPVASGIHALGNVPNPRRMDATTCLITHFIRKRDFSKKVTRVEAFGGGNQAARLTLAGATYTLPTGYSYVTETIGSAHRYWIKHDASDAVGRIDAIQSFDNVAEIDTATGHLSAVNALAQAASVWLGRHIATYYSYEIEVAGLTQAVAPGQTMRVVYDDFSAGRRLPMVDADLLILSVKQRLDADGSVSIPSLTLASSDRWPEDDDRLAANQVTRTQSQSSYVQPAVRAQTADSTAAVTGSVVITSEAWNGDHLVMGAYHIWIDATGDVRIKASAPTSDLDGVVLGTQT